MFEYNPETKRGSSHITVITSNNPSGTLKTNIQDCDGVKQETENNYSPNIVHAASILGGFTASNYKMTDVFNNLNIPGMEKMMEGMKKLDEHNKDKNYGMVNNAIITYDPQTKIFLLLFCNLQVALVKNQYELPLSLQRVDKFLFVGHK